MFSTHIYIYICIYINIYDIYTSNNNGNYYLLSTYYVLDTILKISRISPVTKTLSLLLFDKLGN